MDNNFVLSKCKEHDNCTMKATFLDVADPSGDPITDQKPVSAWVQKNALNAFGPCWCSEIEHVDGTLAIEVPV